MYVNAKITPIETTPGVGERGVKESNRGGEFKCNISDTL
jgi:hypothetical protein